MESENFIGFSISIYNVSMLEFCMRASLISTSSLWLLQIEIIVTR